MCQCTSSYAVSMASHGMYRLFELTRIVYIDMMRWIVRIYIGRRVPQDTHADKKLEIVEVYNEMIKSTVKANGKTATWRAIFPLEVVIYEALFPKHVRIEFSGHVTQGVKE